MQEQTVTQHLARGIGRVVEGKGYDRVMAGKRTLAYVNARRAGTQLDFRTADLADAPARLRRRATTKRDRALLVVQRPHGRCWSTSHRRGPHDGAAAPANWLAGVPAGRHHPGVTDSEACGNCRLDKWLWAARFFKTRGAATEAVLGGHVHVNGARVKPARDLRGGETLEIRNGPMRWTVVVRALADRRGPASVAATLYEETAESREARERLALERRLARPLGAELQGRPTKQDRRRLDALRRGARRRRED